MQIAGPDWPEMAGKIGRKIGQKLAWKIGPENLSVTVDDWSTWQTNIVVNKTTIHK
jgi:hypothetical protein